MVGAVLGAVILAMVPYGPWLLLPFGVLAALLPYAQGAELRAGHDVPDADGGAAHRPAGRQRLAPGGGAAGRHRARLRWSCLLVGYAPWPSAWQAHLPGQFAGTLRSVCRYADEALVEMPGGADRTHRGTARAPASARRARHLPCGRGCGGGAYRSLSNLRTEFQRTMSGPASVSRRATAWWAQAVVALEEVMDAVTSAVVEIGRGGAVPAADSVHALTGALRAAADAIEASALPYGGPERLPRRTRNSKA